MYDVVVAGGGPAGTSCAYHLAKAGFSAAIIERSAFPRTKVCGEYLNAGARDELRALGPLDLAGANAVRAIRLTAHGARAELPFAQPALSIARSDLDARLLTNARHTGVTVIQGSVLSVERDVGFVIRFRDDWGEERTLRSRVVVGADGIGSAVARSCGLTVALHGEARFALGGHYEGLGDLDGCIEMYAGSHTYFAVNPLGAHVANVMLVVRQRDLHAWREDVDANFYNTARTLMGSSHRLDGVRLHGKRLAAGPLTHRVSAAAAPGVYLAGDAAGFVDPFTGQGVYLALHSARLAAQHIVQELAGNVHAYRDYSRAHEEMFATRRRVAALVSWLTRTPLLARRAAHNLESSERLRETVMGAISGNARASALLSPATLLRLVA